MSGKPKYTYCELINEINRFVNENGKVPRLIDMCNKNGYPSASAYVMHFGSWNNALKLAKLPVYKHISNENTKCYICGTKNAKGWCYDDNKNIICSYCYSKPRKFVKGTLDPNCTTGIGIITEHVVYKVLGDCEKCNTIETFHASVDLISKKYGTIDVKSAIMINHNKKLDNYVGWKFKINSKFLIPDYYICIGFDENKIEIQHVWIIPSNSKLVTKSEITIIQNNLQRAIKYEVDSTFYNKFYQNLDIYSLPEFCNFYNKKLTQECDIA